MINYAQWAISTDLGTSRWFQAIFFVSTLENNIKKMTNWYFRPAVCPAVYSIKEMGQAHSWIRRVLSSNNGANVEFFNKNFVEQVVRYIFTDLFNRLPCWMKRICPPGASETLEKSRRNFLFLMSFSNVAEKCWNPR